MKDTRKKILDKSIDLFNQKGVGSVSTNHIAEAMQISPGNLYYHFKNKQDIIFGVFQRMVSEMDTVWNITDTQSNSLHTSISRMLEQSFFLMWQYRFFHREINALVNQDPRLAREYKKIRARRWKEMQQFFITLSEFGVLSPDLSTDMLLRLCKTGWLISEYWLSFLDAGGEKITRKTAREGVDLIFSILSPYLVHPEQFIETPKTED